MKVIDLLNKMANKEEVPKKIRINGYIYEYQGDDYLFIDKNNDNHEYWLFSDGYTDKFQWLDIFLKTEVEVIEEEPRDIEVCGSFFTKTEYDKLAKSGEDKKIEKLNDILRVDDLIPPVDENMYKIWEQTIKNHNKINELIDETIDEINKLKENK